MNITLISSRQCDALWLRIIRNGWDTLSEKEQNAYNHRAEFDNACDCLYYGEGREQWKNRAYENLGKEVADEIWRRAHAHMAKGF